MKAFCFLPLFFASSCFAAPIANGTKNYIVVLKRPLSSGQKLSLYNNENDITEFNIGSKFHSYTGAFSAQEIDQIQADDDVLFAEEDGVVTNQGIIVQDGAPWGISRISQKVWTDTTKYYYDDTAGSSAWVYILDTGIATTHPDFDDRAEIGATFTGETIQDGNGHGTHVAGIAGSTTYGAAKKSRLIAVKVLNSSGSGTTSGVISGLSWIGTNATASSQIGKSVVNISIGGAFSAALNAAVAALVDSGVLVVVAAGSSNVGSETGSPGSEPKVLTVASTDKTDTRRSSSNYGPGIDLFAPGAEILSTWLNGGTAILSGTSMSAAHVTGVAAYLITAEGLTTPAQVEARLKALALMVVKNPGTGTTAGLVYNGAH